MRRTGLGATLLLAVTLSAVIAAICATAASAVRNDSAASLSREFQRLAGGLGGGTALSLGNDPEQFDARLAGRAVSVRTRWRTEPFLGGASVEAALPGAVATPRDRPR